LETRRKNTRKNPELCGLSIKENIQTPWETHVNHHQKSWKNMENTPKTTGKTISADGEKP